MLQKPRINFAKRSMLDLNEAANKLFESEDYRRSYDSLIHADEGFVCIIVPDDQYSMPETIYAVVNHAQTNAEALMKIDPAIQMNGADVHGYDASFQYECLNQADLPAEVDDVFSAYIDKDEWYTFVTITGLEYA